MSLAIEIKNLVKLYGKGGIESKLALDNLEIAVPQGSIFGLLGPNGAGKSTMINILAGMVVKTSGQVKIMDVDIDSAPKRARSLIGVVPQEIVTDSFFPIEQALEFLAGYYGIRPENRRTTEILKALSLYDKRNSLPQRLSGGMKRRFLIAKAMVHSPRVLILDEPTAGVDIELRNQLWGYVKELNKTGITIIITTHYLAEAQELCDEIAFINNGKIVKQDSKNNLLQELGNRYLEVEFENRVDISKETFGVQSVDILSENRVRFMLGHQNNDFNKLLSQINASGVQIKDLRTTEPDLEDIFYQIIKK